MITLTHLSENSKASKLYSCPTAITDLLALPKRPFWAWHPCLQHLGFQCSARYQIRAIFASLDCLSMSAGMLAWLPNLVWGCRCHCNWTRFQTRTLQAEEQYPSRHDWSSKVYSSSYSCLHHHVFHCQWTLPIDKCCALWGLHSSQRRCYKAAGGSCFQPDDGTVFAWWSSAGCEVELLNHAQGEYLWFSTLTCCCQSVAVAN